MKYSDSEIIKAIVAGDDRQVLKYMYDTYFPRMRKFILKNSGDGDSALDVFQDSMVVFYKYLMDGKFDNRYEVGAFLFAVGKNIWYNKVQRDSRNVTLHDNADFMDEGSGVMDYLISRERENAVKTQKYKCMQKLIEIVQATPELKSSLKELYS